MLRFLGVYRSLPAPVRRWLPYWLLAAGAFCAAALVGMAVGSKRETAVVFPVREAGEAAPAIAATDLFVHNAWLALTDAAGALTMGLYTAVSLAWNGFALGSVVADAAGTLGPGTTLLLLVPHGVFELPAIWLAGAIGFRWTHVVWSVANGRSRTVGVPRVALRSGAAFGLVLLLLAVAAVIEAHVTAAIASVLVG